MGSFQKAADKLGYTQSTVTFQIKQLEERLAFPFYMALCIPIHLRQRTSRVYQDHPHFCRVLTSFVPPVHNQGVSLVKKMQSVVAIACKVIRVFYAILTKGVDYDAKKLMGDIRRPQIQAG